MNHVLTTVLTCRVLLSIFGAAVAISTLYDYFLCEDQSS